MLFRNFRNLRTSNSVSIPAVLKIHVPESKTVLHTQVEPHVRRAGQYLIGPRLGVSPVKSIVHCLGRREGTDRYFLLKILQLVIGAKESQVSDLYSKCFHYRGVRRIFLGEIGR